MLKQIVLTAFRSNGN